MSVFRGCLCSSPGLCQQVMPVFSCLCSYIICSPLWSHFWPFMPVFVDYAARGMAIFRYFLLLSIILRSMHVQQYACLVFVVVHTKCMVFDFGKYIQQFCIIYISLYILYSHFHNNSQYSFETINHSSSPLLLCCRRALLLLSCQLQSFL